MVDPRLVGLRRTLALPRLGGGRIDDLGGLLLDGRGDRRDRDGEDARDHHDAKRTRDERAEQASGASESEHGILASRRCPRTA